MFSNQAIVSLLSKETLVFMYEELELVILERVSFNQRNFDMILVNKNYTEKPVYVKHIPYRFLYLIKFWLTNIEIPILELS